MPSSRLSAVARDIRRLAAGAEPGDEQLLDAFRHRRDEQAFATLVRRHAALVMGVCRRTLTHEQDAEDAFQATFLVLARSAAAIRRRESLAGWLHGVTQRIARNARRALANQRRKEQRGARPEATPSGDDLTWGEVRGLLDEEVARLPEAYREAFVLCCLQEVPRPEAARRLGLKGGTLDSRLARAKERLHAALTKRGVTLAALCPAGGKVGPALVKSTAALGFGGAVPARVALLANGAAAAEVHTKAKGALALLALAGLMLAPIASSSKPDAQAREMRPLARAAGPDGEKKELPKEAVAVGVVLDPDGKPIVGANVTVRVSSPHRHDGGTAAATTTDAAGRFRLPYRPPGHAWGHATVVATAGAFGVVWAQPGDKPLTLRLVKDQPIIGKVLDLEGRPVKSARLRVLRIEAAREGSLAKQLEADQDNVPYYERLTSVIGDDLPASLGRATSDAAGVIRLAGVGRDRRVMAVIAGETIASRYVWVVTSATPIPLANRYDPTYTANFTHLADPTRPVTGVVRDWMTKKPLAGVTVRSEKLANDSSHLNQYVAATTDVAGRFRLVGLPKGKGNVLVVEPPEDAPYLSVYVNVPDPFADAPAALDVELRQGVWAEGRVIERETGRSPDWAFVRYHARVDNPYLTKALGAVSGSLSNRMFMTAADGTFRLPVLPGEGAILATAELSKYLPIEERSDAIDLGRLASGRYSIRGESYHGFAPIDAKPDALRLQRDIRLTTGETIEGKLLDPEGKPVVGAWSFNLASREYSWRGLMKSAEFTVGRFNRKKPRWVGFIHTERNLVGVLEAPATGTAVVRMQQGATVTGRLVNEKGQPRAGVRMVWEFEPTGFVPSFTERMMKTDANGVFRYTSLFTGAPITVRYQVGEGMGYQAVRRLTLSPGEAKDLGDVKVRLREE
jgi:RNA polymerase sigma factor (sigma-70 family)